MPDPRLSEYVQLQVHRPNVPSGASARQLLADSLVAWTLRAEPPGRMNSANCIAVTPFGSVKSDRTELAFGKVSVAVPGCSGTSVVNPHCRKQRPRRIRPYRCNSRPAGYSPRPGIETGYRAQRCRCYARPGLLPGRRVHAGSARCRQRWLSERSPSAPRESRSGRSVGTIGAGRGSASSAARRCWISCRERGAQARSTPGVSGALRDPPLAYEVPVPGNAPEQERVDGSAVARQRRNWLPGVAPHPGRERQRPAAG